MKHLPKNKIGYIYAAAVALFVLSVILGVSLGSTEISFFDLVKAIFGHEADTATTRIIWYVRFPRIAAGLFCGAALAVSGAVIQAVLQNRLASPSIIGVNSGAGLAITLCSSVGIIGGWRTSFFAFLGAFVTVMIVSLGAKKWGASRGTVILIGVALNALLGALSDTVTTFSPEIAVFNNDFKVGDFSAVTYAKLIPAIIIIIVSTGILLTLSSQLDVLTLGDDNAKGLGMNTGIMRVVFLVLSSLLAGAAVSIAGLLSFVGLLVPHAVRRVTTTESRHLLPLSFLFGAGFVTFCDTISRVVFTPYELPVGIIMAFFGAPFFIFILIKGKGGHGNA